MGDSTTILQEGQRHAYSPDPTPDPDPDPGSGLQEGTVIQLAYLFSAERLEAPAPPIWQQEAFGEVGLATKPLRCV